ncbi:4-(cytidine 5'-diphospho)-2-C-methyl-D-erythritol kinase [Rhodobacteraceae bacterium RKSG542]|uniref:4-(cytidine 5'-diphospho)-2-C-methyl-D-erythritol kinase n=1 Tax=Pseudovibrio flavus TaxID=2529854 RepID=UPI0012BB71A9|nr:4-(cytidine 5'-diphospho)-2-C-methyl-D-erythritol kinase [Pseudovibrio flavus]MTI19339.1 4-(cytidine 5'-diphospho)-2-C-methyl-D-erythritol kinase [Pseudovibrio flavus]
MNAIVSSPTQVEELARAKVNLALHVTGQREDGYHLLDSVVVFPEFGDRLTLAPSDATSLDIEGPFADLLPGDQTGNLIFKAAQLLAESVPNSRGAMIGMVKALPVSAGIGGGSADAAATFRALTRLWGISPSKQELEKLAARLGADVPMCLQSNPIRCRGIGEIIEPIPALPKGALVLVNPGVSLATPVVFEALQNKKNSGLPQMPEKFASIQGLAEWLKSCRNDLQAPATTLVPEIADVISVLQSQPETLLARMSGSGATCFALCSSLAAAQQLEERIRDNRPNWWCVAAPF